MRPRNVVIAERCVAREQEHQEDIVDRARNSTETRLSTFCGVITLSSRTRRADAGRRNDLHHDEEINDMPNPILSVSARGFETILPGVRWMKLHLPSPRSSLSWRDCLAFSAVNHLTLRHNPVTYRAVARLTSLDAEAVPVVLARLQDLELLGGEFRPAEPPDLAAHLATRRANKVEHFTDKLVYYRYPILAKRRHGKGEGLEPYDCILLAFFVLRWDELHETTVSYLAKCTGIDRKQVRASLARFDDHGLQVDRAESGKLLLNFKEFRPNPVLFRKRKAKKRATKAAAPCLDGVPAFVADAYHSGRIRRGDIGDFTALATRLEGRFFPGEWFELLKSCWAVHSKGEFGHLPMTYTYVANRVKDILVKRAALN